MCNATDGANTGTGSGGTLTANVGGGTTGAFTGAGVSGLGGDGSFQSSNANDNWFGTDLGNAAAVSNLNLSSLGAQFTLTLWVKRSGGNNADILNLDYSVEYAVEKAAEEGKTYLLELKARSAAVAYDRLKMRVDRASLMPTEIECFAASGLLIKTLRFKDMKDFGGGLRRPATMETDSPLHKDYKSVMLYGSIKARTLADEIFTLDYLPRAGELR